jgi:Fe-S cluster assembly protein SufD
MAASANSPETFASDFERVKTSLAGASLPWLAELRTSALASLSASGFPSVRDEDWKYTNVSPALRDRLEPVLPSEVRVEDGSALLAGGAASALLFDAAGKTGTIPVLDRRSGEEFVAEMTGVVPAILVFVDGSYQPSLSNVREKKGLRVSSLRERLSNDPASVERWLGRYLPASAHGFAALNTAFLDDGAVVEIAEGAAIDGIIHLVFLSTSREKPYVTHPRNVVIAGAGSSSCIVEHYVGADGARYLCNTATEIVVGRSASLAHARIQDDSPAASHIARIEVEQAAGSSFRSLALAFGAAISRAEISVRLAGEEAECDLAGLYAIDGSRHADHHLMIDHAQPRTRSNQLYKGVLDDSARGVFTGRVVVRAGAQKIKAMQSNPSLLLGRGAVAETRPQLEIYADDVACNHGATIGRLDEDALFYLLSRGIEAREARRILVSGFAAETIENVRPEALREALLAQVSQRIGRLGATERGKDVAGKPGARKLDGDAPSDGATS